MVVNFGRMCNTLQSPTIVLSALEKKSSSDKSYKFHRLYRNLYNPEFFALAYQQISPKEGNMTKGVDGETIDGMSKKKIDSLIESLKNHSYQPAPVRRTYIPKKQAGKLRPLGIPSFKDKLVQQVMKYILEAIYENSFSIHSHGFRPERSCHTALREIKVEFRGTKWFVEGDICGFFDNIDHHVLITILRKRIADENFISLVWKFLKAGYMENWRYNPSYSGTPQGGIISPLLANIYLNEFDTFMESKMSEFHLGEKSDRKYNKEYIAIREKVLKKRRQIRNTWENLSEDNRKQQNKELSALVNQMLSKPYYDPNSTAYKRLKYVRYADDFIIAIHGSKEDAKKLKVEIATFLKETLKLELSEEKTLITHSGTKARFLGYDIVVNRENKTKHDKNGILKRVYNYNVQMYVPREVWQNNLIKYKALKISYNENGKEIWEAVHRPFLSNLDDLEILTQYNAEIRGLYNYYRYAENSTVIQKFAYIMEYSLYKTFANKYKSTMSKIIKKYKKQIDGKMVFGINYKTKKGSQTSFLYHEGFRKHDLIKSSLPKCNDTMPKCHFIKSGTSLMDRIKSEICELCGAKGVPIEMHHVRKLKDLQGKSDWEYLMIARNRKTLAVCLSCHRKISCQQRGYSTKSS